MILSQHGDGIPQVVAAVGTLNSGITLHNKSLTLQPPGGLLFYRF